MHRLNIAGRSEEWDHAAEADLLERATGLARIGAWQCDLIDDRLTWTRGVFDLFGLSASHRPDRRHTLSLYSEASRIALERMRSRAIAERSGFAMDAEIVRVGGEQRWMRLTAQTIVRNGRTIGLYGTKQDVTDERAEWTKLRRLAEQDMLTGLASRALFQTSFLDGPPAEAGQALILVDIDRFKPVNDCFGHAAGDACLEEVGRRLRAAFPDAMTARVGGDEFAILTQAGASLATIVQRADALIRRIADPIPWQGDLLQVGASAGIASAPAPAGCSARRLFGRADAALYAAKNDGRGRLSIAPPT